MRSVSTTPGSPYSTTLKNTGLAVILKVKAKLRTIGMSSWHCLLVQKALTLKSGSDLKYDLVTAKKVLEFTK